MAVTVHTMKNYKKQFEKQVLDFHTERAESVKKAQEDNFKRLLKQTTTDPLGSGTKAFADAVPYPKTTIQAIQGQGVRISTLIVMKGKGSTPHKIWHYISGGTPDRTQKKTSPPIRERKATRTKMNEMKTSQFSGYTGKIFIIPAGKHVRGIPARLWYEKLLDIHKETMRKQSVYADWVIENTTIEYP